MPDGPHALPAAAARLWQLHDQPLALRRALLDVAFAAGASVHEQALALESGDALLLEVATTPAPRWSWTVIDLQAPTGQAWPADSDCLGGPSLTLLWWSALQVLRAAPDGWSLLYARGPATDLPAVLAERADADQRTLLVPCPSQPGSVHAKAVVVPEARPVPENTRCSLDATPRPVEDMPRAVDAGRDASAQLLLAVAAAEAQGPAPAGLSGPIWRLPPVAESGLWQRVLASRLTSPSE